MLSRLCSANTGRKYLTLQTTVQETETIGFKHVHKIKKYSHQKLNYHVAQLTFTLTLIE